MTGKKCEYCSTKVTNYNSINKSSENGFMCVCLHCYNKEMSEETGIDYDHIELQPILLQDSDSVDHTFHFTVRLLEERLVLKSFEIDGNNSAGYEFSMIGDIEDGLFALFSKLYEKMLKVLSMKHIYKDDDIGDWRISDEDIVRGQITCTPDSVDFDRNPMLIIDGKEISWEDFGQMLMTYEGFNFKLQIFDESDEMD